MVVAHYIVLDILKGSRKVFLVIVISTMADDEVFEVQIAPVLQREVVEKKQHL
jgi:hypothetical protein